MSARGRPLEISGFTTTASPEGAFRTMGAKKTQTLLTKFLPESFGGQVIKSVVGYLPRRHSMSLRLVDRACPRTECLFVNDLTTKQTTQWQHLVYGLPDSDFYFSQQP